jgi:DNA-binding NarL/FixJ family response regulator
MPRRTATTSSASASLGEHAPFPLDADVWEQVAEEMQLSEQHRRIVELLLRGAKCKQLGPALGIAEPTVHTYLKRIYQRQGVGNHTELLLRVMALSQRFNRRASRHGSR